MIELVMHQSPLDDGNIAELYLEKAMQEFCEYTGMVRRRVSIELSGEKFLHSLDAIDDMIAIREFTRQDVKLVNTTAPSYLKAGNGFWYVDTTTGAVPVVYLGKWSGSEAVPFKSGDTLEMVYKAYARLVPLDDEDNKDYSKEPEIPRRWHDCIVSRASEKANLNNPQNRSYFYNVWRDESRKAKIAANSANTDAEWNVKIYTL